MGNIRLLCRSRLFTLVTHWHHWQRIGGLHLLALLRVIWLRHETSFSLNQFKCAFPHKLGRRRSLNAKAALLSLVILIVYHFMHRLILEVVDQQSTILNCQLTIQQLIEVAETCEVRLGPNIVLLAERLLILVVNVAIVIARGHRLRVSDCATR